MTENEATAMGEAVYAGMMVPILVAMPVKKEFLSSEEIADATDKALLVLERRRGEIAAEQHVAIDYARTRLEGLLAIYSRGIPSGI